MLALTQDAVEVIRGIVESADEPLPDEAGLRIAADSIDSEGAQLSITVVEGPLEGDERIDAAGATVYLSGDASMLLDDKVLHAQEHDDHVHFTIGEREGAAE